jgi:hypothetical protein
MKAARQRFDVNAWFDLAEKDPDAFEDMRQRVIEEYVASAPPRLQQRLRRLQWRIDQECRLAGTPLAACIRLSHLMWERVTGPNGLLDSIDRLSEVVSAPDAAPSSPPPLSARVIPFSPPRSKG